MKKTFLAVGVLLAASVAHADDIRSCVADAVNFTAIATMAVLYDPDEKGFYKALEEEASHMKSKEQHDWLINAGKIAWKSKDAASPAELGLNMYDVCMDVKKTMPEKKTHKNIENI
jgi:hypothetical protein